MKLTRQLASLAVVLVLFATAAGLHRDAAARSAPAPSPSPTNPPTPYMAPDQVTNGTWDVILQMAGQDPTYSTMKLTDVGDAVTGVWIADRRTVYPLSGKRDGKHLALDIKDPKKPGTVVGKIDADIDGIADIVGILTLAGVDTPFQAAQHSRVPPPVEPSPGANPTPTPY